MKIEQLKNKITEYSNKITELRKQTMEELRKDFHTALVELFDAHPFVHAVHFTAYTPYFNDGDECTYSCHQDDCGFNGFETYSEGKSKCISNAFGDIEGENIRETSKPTIYVEMPNPDYTPSNTRDWSNSKTKWVEQPNPNFNTLHEKAVKDFRSALNAVNDESWKELVGDHCIVMIDRKGIHVEEYEHN